jgi:two-component system cell cycle sensor histidine kinase/response regulator CckA
MKPRVIDLNRRIAELNRMLRRVIGDDIELETLCAPDLELTLADPAQIEQVMLNLVVNARDAMPDGGSLTIETGNVQVEPGRAEVPAGRYVMLAVKDTGVGISDADRPHIFEPFFTTKQDGGTGLGLATAYGIVRQSGGTIDVASQAGRGTTFKVLLPRAEATAAAPAAGRAAPDRALEGSETLLLVEDSDLVRGYLRTALEQHGYRVIEASDGRQALARARSAQTPIGMVLTDVTMPRLGGIELAQRLHEELPSLPVVFMSGYPERVAAEALENVEVLLRKPFTARELLSTVRRILDDGSGAQREQARTDPRT